MGSKSILSLLLVAIISVTATSFVIPSSSTSFFTPSTTSTNTHSTIRGTESVPTAFVPNENYHNINSKYGVTSLSMSDSGGGGGGGDESRERSKKKGISTIVIDRTELASKQEEKKEEQWRVVLHNDEVHTFNYVIQSLCKVIGTVDRKRAFDICVVTHGTGKATITQTWKDQAMKYCFGLQRQGLTASIAPESRFTGGGGDGDGDGGGDGGGGDGE